MYEAFGAVVTGNNVEFRLFFPDTAQDPTQYGRGGRPQITRVHVVGDFQSVLGGAANWTPDDRFEMRRGSHPNGEIYTLSIPDELPPQYYQYKYFVEFENRTTRWCTDPCTKYGGETQQNSAFVIGGNRAVTRPITNRLPSRDLVIYELMPFDFTSTIIQPDEAPFDTVRRMLDYLQRLGVNAIECMPWTAWVSDESFSWGYDPVQFFSVEYRYINASNVPADKLVRLSQLINEMHDRGMHVIMDGVFNHVNGGDDPNKGFGYKWLYEVPRDSPFIGPFAGGGFFDELDYNNECTQRFILDVCTYWFDRFQIDGIRFDYTLGFYRPDEANGITQLVTDLRTYFANTNRRNIALFIEHLTDNRYDAISDTNRICADGCWFDPGMFAAFRYAHNGNIDDEALRVLNSGLDFASGKGPVTYIENHDHSQVIAEAGGRDRWFKTQPAAISLLTTAGSTMIHNGQEFGDDYWLPGEGSGRVVPRPLHWQQYGPDSGDFVGGRLFSLYQRLIAMRKEHPALRSVDSSNFAPWPGNFDGYGAFPETDIVVYQRRGRTTDGRDESFVIIVSWSDFDHWITIPFPTNGRWDDLLNGGSVIVNNQQLLSQRISSNWGRVYCQRS